MSMRVTMAGSDRWVRLAQDAWPEPSTELTCPDCGARPVQRQWLPKNRYAIGDDEGWGEVHLWCPSCGAETRLPGRKRSGVTVFPAPFIQRLIFSSLGLGGLVIVVLSGDLWLAWLAVVSVALVLEGVRSQVEVDHERRVVRSRMVRTTTVPIEDIESVELAKGRRIALVLRPGAPKPIGGIQRGVVVTGLYSNPPDDRRRSLAAALDVPVAPRRGVPSD
jgi:predicted RNA-binding Zn-ribbon protein involved in translation (DUF1610 family)